MFSRRVTAFVARLNAYGRSFTQAGFQAGLFSKARDEVTLTGGPRTAALTYKMSVVHLPVAKSTKDRSTAAGPLPSDGTAMMSPQMYDELC